MHDITLNGNSTMSLEDRFEVLKEIGDGSFGSVVLARVRGAGSNIARRGTVVSRYKNKNDNNNSCCCCPSSHVPHLLTVPALRSPSRR